MILIICIKNSIFLFSAPNYKVPFKDYIKNVASCEIYSTWNNSALGANIFCIASFTLNRISTEWYRVKGKNFDIIYLNLEYICFRLYF